MSARAVRRLVAVAAAGVVIAALVYLAGLPPRTERTARTLRSARPERVVSLTPYVTETLFAIGAGERVVGVGAGEDHPPAAAVVPSVVGDDGLTPDTAKIAALSPDLVIVAAHATDAIVLELRQRGLRVGPTPLVESIDQAVALPRVLGRLVGQVDRGDALSGELRRTAADFRRRTSSARRPKVLIEAFYPPLTIAGPRSYPGEIVAAAGGEVIGADTPQEEWTAQRAAEAGADLYLAAVSSGVSAEAVKARPGFGAIAGGRVSVVRDFVLFRPGPRMPQALRELERILEAAPAP